MRLSERQNTDYSQSIIKHFRRYLQNFVIPSTLYITHSRTMKWLNIFEINFWKVYDKYLLSKFHTFILIEWISFKEKKVNWKYFTSKQFQRHLIINYAKQSPVTNRSFWNSYSALQAYLVSNQNIDSHLELKIYRYINLETFTFSINFSPLLLKLTLPR